MYDISFDDVVSQLFPGKIKLSLVHEGENRIHGFSVYNITRGLNYIWAIYKLPSGATKVDQQTPLENGDEQFDVEFPNCLLTEHGRLLVQIVATDSDEDILTIFDEYAAGTFNGIIQKSRVYEFYVNESLDALQEMASPSGGISQAVKDYIEELVEEAGGGSVDPAVLNSKMDKVNPTGSGAISVGRALVDAGGNSVPVGQNSVALGENVKATAARAVALGSNTEASSYAAFAEGEQSEASGSGSHAEGRLTKAKGLASHSEGQCTIAGSAFQHVQGKYSIEDEDGRYAHIVGNGSSITDRSNAHTVDWDGNAWYSGDVRVGGSDYDHATPLMKSVSVDLYSITHPGRAPEIVTDILYDVAGSASAAVQCDHFTDMSDASEIFQSVLSDGSDIFCLGALGAYNVDVVIEQREAVDTDPEGSGTIDVGYWLLINAERWTSTGSYLARFKRIDDTKPVYILSVLYDGTVELFTSNLTGYMALVYGAYGTPVVEEELAELLDEKADKDNAVITSSLSMGRVAGNVIGENSVALGHDCTASGTFGHAEGMGTTASGTRGAHAEGEGSTASGHRGCHAEGKGTTASGESSHAEGSNTGARGKGSHSEGFFTSATGDFSHSEGAFNAASGRQSHVEGRDNNALGNCQHVQGELAIDDASGRYAHIVGNGRSIINQQGETEYLRSNAHTVDWDGNAWYSGDVRVGGSDYDHSTPLAKATIVELYETTMSLAQSSYPISILNDSNENAITTYSDESLEPATELLLKAIANSVSLRIGDYPLTVVSTYDPDNGATLLGYALVYNAEAMSAMNLQWKKIDDTKPIFEK